jgi:hypothetical protein
VTKHIPADVTAQIFWLKNRQPNRWKDVRDLMLGGQPGNPVQVVMFGKPKQTLMRKPKRGKNTKR